MKIEVYSVKNENELLRGTITYDGSKFHLEPEDDKLLRSMMQDKIRVGKKTLTFHDGDEFLKAMELEYRSVYLHVVLSETNSGQAAAAH